DGVELARVPAGRDPEDQAASGDDVERAERLRDHDRVAEREHEHARSQPYPARAGGDGGQGAQGVQDREGGVDAEDDVVPGPERLEDRKSTRLNSSHRT